MNTEKQTHTPGPWRVGMPSGHNASLVYGPIETVAIAQVYMLPSNKTVAECEALAVDYKDAATGLANARLIAEAPAMLEALRNAAEAMEANDWPIENGSTVQRLRAIIARAEGGTR